YIDPELMSFISNPNTFIVYLTPLGDDKIERPLGRLFVHRNLGGKTYEIDYSHEAGIFPEIAKTKLTSIVPLDEDREHSDDVLAFGGSGVYSVPTFNVSEKILYIFPSKRIYGEL